MEYCCLSSCLPQLAVIAATAARSAEPVSNCLLNWTRRASTDHHVAAAVEAEYWKMEDQMMWWGPWKPAKHSAATFDWMLADFHTIKWQLDQILN